MSQAIGCVSLLVRDYDEAIAFYIAKLGFKLIEDTRLSPTKRWVLVAPEGPNGTRLLLAKAADAGQDRWVGNQAGGRVFLFLYTTDFTRDHSAMRESGVTFLEEPRHETYGCVAVFQDLYGNRWDLVERREPM